MLLHTLNINLAFLRNSLSYTDMIFKELMASLASSTL